MNPDPTSLDRLHDIVVPAPVPLWPPAPGWYYVIGLMVATGVVLLVRGFVRWQRNRYRREALAEWSRLNGQLADSTRRVGALAELGALLKRTAITAYTRAEVAGLSGPEWFTFLDRTGQTDFTTGVGGQLAAAAYDPATVASLDEAAARKIAARVRAWIVRHRGCDARVTDEGTSIPGKASDPRASAGSSLSPATSTE